MTWHAELALDYSLEAGRCVARHRHSGPLRVLQSLYPEGDAICHNVLVHPPGGLVGGDTLDLTVTAHSGAHGLVTTPGATRFYRSEGELATQHTRLIVKAGARLEWLPLEAICFSGCRAENRLELMLEDGAEMIGWDITALGLKAADKPFETGSFCQHIELPGVWLERARINANDRLLLNSPLGMAGRSCIATLFFATGSRLERKRKQDALDAACEIIARHPLAASAGVTSPNAQVIVLRVLAPVVEPATDLLRLVRNAWRSQLWNCAANSPRIWST